MRDQNLYDIERLENHSAAKLSCVEDLRGEDLKNVDLSRSNLFRADLRGTDLRGANLCAADLGGVDLSRANLEKANLSKANLFKATLRNANLSEANLREAKLSGADLSGANLRKANFNAAYLFEAKFSRSELSGVDLSDANLRYANLSNLDLSGVDLSGADLRGADLSGSDLSGADLSKTVLKHANLSATDLRCSDLRGADLTSAELYKADLFAADLRESNLSEISLLKTKVEKADVRGAFLKKGDDLSESERQDLKERGVIFEDIVHNHGYGNPFALKPQFFIEELEDGDVHELRCWLKETLGDRENAVVQSTHLLERWFPSPSQRLTRRESLNIFSTLEGLGYCVEPDIRLGGRLIEFNSKIVIFRLPYRNIITPSNAYLATKILVRLAVTIFCSNSLTTASERERINEYIEIVPNLSSAERIRLRAYLALLLQQNQNLRGISYRLAKISSKRKAEIASFLISMVGANGHINKKSVSMLSKIYPLLGFEAHEIYNHIHSFSTFSPDALVIPATEPITVRAASAVNQGFAIPAPISKNKFSEKRALEFDLDIIAIKRKQEESTEVNSLLTTIFDEEEDSFSTATALAEPNLPNEGKDSIAGLDDIHAQFLKILIQRPTWSRDALESKASELNLMLDGALEVLNDAAFDSCEEPLTDGDDPIELDADVLEQLMS